MVCHLPSEKNGWDCNHCNRHQLSMWSVHCLICITVRHSSTTYQVIMHVLLMFLYVVEHMFEVIIENMSGLKLLDNMIWGEADCFIQYHFPAQMANAGRVGGATVVCGMLFLSLLQIVIIDNNLIISVRSVIRWCSTWVWTHTGLELNTYFLDSLTHAGWMWTFVWIFVLCMHVCLLETHYRNAVTEELSHGHDSVHSWSRLQRHFSTQNSPAGRNAGAERNFDRHVICDWMFSWRWPFI